MVKIREELPKNAKGSLDIDAWITRVIENRDPSDKALLKEAAMLSLEQGGHHLTPVKESCLRQGLLIDIPIFLRRFREMVLGRWFCSHILKRYIRVCEQ